MNKIRFWLLLISFIFINPASATWYDGSWTYKVDLNSSANGITTINISTVSGTNTITNIFCNSHCNSNLSDLRVTVNDTTPIAFWVQPNPISTNTFRVWINKTAAGAINVYYGNSGAISNSSGINTFPLFDDFNGASINTSMWTQSGATVSGGIATVTSAASEYLQSVQTFGQGYEWVSNATLVRYKSGTDESEWAWGFHGGTQYNVVTSGLNAPLTSYQALTKNTGSQNWVNLGNLSTDKYNVWSIIKNGSTNIIYTLNDTVITSTASGVSTMAMPVKYENDASRAGHNTLVDWVFVTTFPEISKINLSIEQAAPAPTLTPTPTATPTASPAPTGSPTPTPTATPAPTPTPAPTGLNITNITYHTNYKNATFECIQNILNNVTIDDCHGEIAVIPYNQDLIVVMQVIQTCALSIIALYLLFSFALARRG